MVLPRTPDGSGAGVWTDWGPAPGRSEGVGSDDGDRGRHLVIKGSIRYVAGCYPAATDLISSGRFDVKRLITNRFRIQDAEQAFALVKAGRHDVFKVMISGVEQ